MTSQLSFKSPSTTAKFFSASAPLFFSFIFSLLAACGGGGGGTSSTGTISSSVSSASSSVAVVPPIVDTTAPAVVIVSPADAATEVAIDSAVSVNFSEAIDPTTLDVTNFTFTTDDGVVEGTVTYSETTAVFTPAAPLAFSRRYTATLSTGVKDVAGNALAESYDWSFTTVAEPVAAVLDAEARSGAVTLRWDDTGADTYNVIYATEPGCDPANYLSCEGGTLLTNITSPYLISDLSNGKSVWITLESQFNQESVRSEEVGAHPGLLVKNGEIYTMAVGEDGTAYVGGEFTYIGPETGPGAIIDMRTSRAGAFPRVDGTVKASVPDGIGGWYIGGSFESVGGEPRRNLAHVSASGQVNAWNPQVQGSINSLVLANDKIYIGGNFDAVNGIPRSSFAVIDKDGALTDLAIILTRDPVVNVLTTAGTTVYIGGQFELRQGSKLYKNLMAINAQGEILRWRPVDNPDTFVTDLAVVGDRIYISEFDPGICMIFCFSSAHLRVSLVNAISFAVNIEIESPNFFMNPYSRPFRFVASEDRVYVSGYFERIAGQLRNNFAAFELDGRLSDWQPSNLNYGEKVLAVSNEGVYVSGQGFKNFSQRITRVNFDGTLSDWELNADYEYDIETMSVSDDRLYVGGTFSSIGGATRNYVAALDVNGHLTDWNPNANDIVRALAVDGQSIYIGGDFTDIDGADFPVNGEPRKYLASVNTDGVLSSWSPNANGQVRALSINGGKLYTGGAFTSFAGYVRNRVASFDRNGLLTDWKPNINDVVNALTILNDRVYVGGRFSVVDGRERNNLAAVSTGGTLSDWQPSLEQSKSLSCGWEYRREFGQEVTALAHVNNRLYVGGCFDRVDNKVRPYLAAVGEDGTVEKWEPSIGYFHSDSRTAIKSLVAANYIYALGGFTKVANENRRHLAVFDLSGVLHDAIPGINDVEDDFAGAVEAVAVTGGRTYMVGNFPGMIRIQ